MAPLVVSAMMATVQVDAPASGVPTGVTVAAPSSAVAALFAPFLNAATNSQAALSPVDCCLPPTRPRMTHSALAGSATWLLADAAPASEVRVVVVLLVVAARRHRLNFCASPIAAKFPFA